MSPARASYPAGGSVVSLWRYPVKSMMGEELSVAEVTPRGVLGDRSHALIDHETGKVASAKNPRKWPNLFQFHARCVEPANPEAHAPSLRITLPDGTSVTSQQSDLDDVLSHALGRAVTFQTLNPDRSEGVASSSSGGTHVAEGYDPDLDAPDSLGTVSDFDLPEGTFFDSAVIHLLTTSTLDRLHALNPEGRFEVPRFRPNLVLQAGDGQEGFVENGWVGHTLAIGNDVRLHVTEPCPRCVMTTLAQGDLPKDIDILRTAVRHNGSNIGVYGAVIQSGVVRPGDAVRVV